MTRRDIPNALSALRILLIAPLVIAIARGEHLFAFGLFFVAGFSDGLDGFLARRFDWRTRLGGFLDPIADKLMTLSVFAAMAFAGLIPRWLAALVIGRDVVIVVGALAYRVFIGRFSGAASVVSKINTLAMLVYVISVLSHAAFGLPGHAVLVALGGMLMATVVVSGLDYVMTWSRMAIQSEKTGSA